MTASTLLYYVKLLFSHGPPAGPPLPWCYDAMRLCWISILFKKKKTPENFSSFPYFPLRKHLDTSLTPRPSYTLDK